MSDFDAIKASEGRNAEAWAEIGQFIIEGRAPADEDIDTEELDDLNERGDVDNLDEDDVPEGFFKCDSCGAVDLEEEAVSTTYGAICDQCDEMDAWLDD